MMSMCRVFSCVVRRGCLLWPVHSLGKTLLALPCFILYSKIKFACYSRYFLTSYFCIPGSYNEKDIFWGVLALEGLLGLHRTIQLQLLQHYWLGYRIALLWYWMICLGNEQRSFCHFWDFIQVLHFFGRNDAKAESPVLWPPHAKSWLIGKDSDAWRDWGREEKGMTEDEMAGWHHWLDGHESQWNLGVGDGQGGLACCDSWGRKESDTTERLIWSEVY